MNSRLSMLLALAAVVAFGCESRRDDAPTGTITEAATASALHADAPSGIAWSYDVETALAQAEREAKPVFLYWGAVWCPYCADLKAHVFARRDIQEKLKLFVTIYLDGDDAGAQKWGEEFAIAGYPTVLALDADRQELARIAGGMDVAVYAEMLDLVLGDVRPVSALLGSLEDGADPLSADDCRRLAYNGWGLGDESGTEIAALLARAIERCPVDAQVERARLTAIATAYAVDAETHEIEFGEPPSPELTQLIAATRALVAERELAIAAGEALLYLSEDFFKVVHGLDEASAAELAEDWGTIMDAAADDARFTEGDRLGAVRSKVLAVKTLVGDGIVPPELEAAARARADAALARTAGTPAAPGTINAAVNLFVALDDLPRAYAVAEAAVAHAKTPYYHMADLAYLDEHMGRTDSAIEWLERAYRESQGPATRFQWGTNYVRGLIRMRPDDEAAVRDAMLAVLSELEGPNRIYRRSRARLETLDADLREWNIDGKHANAIAAIRERMASICTQVPATEESALASCRGFLADAG
jgi:tetratricopeptide (TPR) repeat protein/thiol-disulfide isomerase/thioredoxin